MPKSCSIEGCDRVHYGKGMCKRHYMWQWNRGPRARAYEAERRDLAERRQQERARNKRRRPYINLWIRVNRHRLEDPACEPIDPRKVFERDGYRCGICGSETHGVWPEPTAATVDHIVPLSKGGEHSYANVQCACWVCNLRKGSNMLGEQLELR